MSIPFGEIISDNANYAAILLSKAKNPDLFHDCFVISILKSIHPTGQHYCGYIEINENSYFFKKHMFDCNELKVHGGITYSEDGNEFLHAIIDRDSVYEAYDFHKNVWILGFDCLHWGDMRDPKNFDYVYKELHSLSQQIHKIDAEKVSE